VGVTSVEDLVEHTRQLRLRGIVTYTMGVGVNRWHASGGGVW
jgi:hypothetical protein